MRAKPWRLDFLAVFSVLTISTLSLKWVFEDRVDYDKLHPTFMQYITNALTGAGFNIILLADPRTVSGYKNACFVWIGTSRPEGGGDSYFISAYGGLGELSFWYKNELFEARPGLRVLFDRYSERVKIALFQKPNIHQIYHIVSTDECSEDELRGLELDGVF